MNTEPKATASDIDSFPDEDDGEMIGRRKNAAASAGAAGTRLRKQDSPDQSDPFRPLGPPRGGTFGRGHPDSSRNPVELERMGVEEVNSFG